MGGAAAKQRRKEQRQHLQPQEGISSSEGTTAFPKKRKDGTPFAKDKPYNRSRHSHEKYVPPRKLLGSMTNPASNKSGRDKSNNKEKKFKKPKHLKRKLEIANDEEAKEQLRDMLEDFEKKKKKKKKSKFSSDDSMPSMHEEKEELQFEVRETEVDFPQSSHHKKVTDNENKAKPPSPNDSDDSHEEKEENSDAKPIKSTESLPKQNSVEGAFPSVDDSSPWNGSNSDNDLPSDDDEKGGDQKIQRSRGKRRRGRPNTSQAVQENNIATKKEDEKSVTTRNRDSHDGNKTQNEKQKSNQDRYCLGRKPVTDFIIGGTYQGKVVYMKPFGVFLDIGCHSDAFCHISRLSDDYVEKPESLFEEGDTVPSVRVIEIDRRAKRITVSLQSEGRIADERKAIESRRQRKEKRQRGETSRSNNATDSQEQSGLHPKQEEKQKDHNGKHNNYITAKNAPRADTKAESEMTPGELKRARKLARRAARRAEQTEGNEGDEE